MCKKITLLLVLFCTLTQYASHGGPWLEIKPSYFLFSSFPMNKIYNHGGFEVQGCVSVPVCKHLDFYGSIGYRQASGHALGICEKTNIKMIPVDIGLKPVFNFCERYYYFFAVGPRYLHFKQHNKSAYVDCSIDGGCFGFFVNTGFNVELKDCLLLGIFGEYSYEKTAICSRKPNVYSNGHVQLGGFAFGLSLGYAF